MKQRLAFLLFTLLSLTFESFAQVSVQGRILGQYDKQPIVAALVTLTPVSGGSARQAVSDEEESLPSQSRAVTLLGCAYVRLALNLTVKNFYSRV